MKGPVLPMPKKEKESRRNRDAEIQVLRKENEALRRQVGRMRKLLEKRGLDAGEDAADDEPALLEAPAPKSEAKCSKCGAHGLREVAGFSSVFLICPSCHHRQRVV